MTETRRPRTELIKEEKDLVIKFMLESKCCGGVTLRLHILKYYKTNFTIT
jgi:hypothetical protein